MKFLAVLATTVALVSAAVLDPVHSLVQREVVNSDVTAFALPDGRSKLEVVVDGVLEGTIVETADGGLIAYDAFGKEIDLDAEHDADSIVKRGKLDVILKLGKILKRWGGRAWTFFKCTGYGAAVRCGDEFLDCAQYGQPPWTCIEGLACVGGSAKKCV